jgi:hypothetical protein
MFTLMCVVILFNYNAASAVLGEKTLSQDFYYVASKKQVFKSKKLNNDHKIIKSNATPSLDVYEYVNAHNEVFAIRWSGVQFPNLLDLLGRYFSRYQKHYADVQNRVLGNRRHFQMDDQEFHLQTWSDGRLLHGFAYLDDLKPRRWSANVLFSHQ